MLNFKQLQTITKKEILKAFKNYFNVEIRHPNGAEDSNYFVQKTFVSLKTIKKIFKVRFEDKNLIMDLRRIDTWAEMFLQCRELINCTLSKKDKHQKHYGVINAKVAEDLEKLNFILKEMKLSIKDKFVLVFKAQGYNTRKLIDGTSLEVGYGSYHVDAAFNGERFMKTFQPTQKTYAIFEKEIIKNNKNESVVIDKCLVKHLTLPQLKIELVKQLEKIKIPV